MSSSVLKDGRLETHDSCKQLDQKQPEENMPPFSKGLCIFALILGVFLTALDLSIITTAIPRITSDFHSLDDVGWYGSVFFMVTCVFQPVWGKVYMHLNVKYVLITTLVIFELGTLGCAVANNSSSFIGGRAVAGFGGAGIITGVYTIISHITKPEALPMFFGLVGLAFTLAGVLGPIMGGAFTSYVSWRWCFYINLPICGVVIIILLVLLTLPSTANPRKVGLVEFFSNLDPFGVTTIIGSLLCLLFAIELGGIKYPWDSPVPIGTLVGCAMLLLVSIGVENVQGNRAILPRRFFKNRGIATCCAFVFCFNAAVYYRIYYFPIYLQAIHGASPERSGILFLALLLPTSIFSLLAGGLLAKVGYYQPFMLIGAAIATIGSGLIYTLDVNWSLGKVIGYQFLVGVGDGIVVQIPVTAVQAFASVEDIPAVTGAVLFWQLCGGVIGIAAGQSIFSNRLLQTLPRYAPKVNATEVLRIGASAVSTAVPPESLLGVKQSYLASLRGGWAMTVAFCGVAFLIAVFVPPISIAGRIGVTRASGSGSDSADSRVETIPSSMAEKSEGSVPEDKKDAVEEGQSV